MMFLSFLRVLPPSRTLRRAGRVSVLLLLCLLRVSVVNLYAAGSGLEEPEPKLGAVAEEIVREMKARNPDAQEFTIAVMPFVDPGTKLTRGIGVDTAQAIERKLIAARPEWLRVQARILLGSILDEHKLWVLDIVKDGRSEQKPFVEKSDLLVVGSVAFDRESVRVEWRLVVTRTSHSVASGKVELAMTPQLWERRAFVDPPPGQSHVEKLPAVSDLQVVVRAQRQVGFTGVREWEVKPGETLRSGDQFCVEFSPDANANVYVLCYGSDKTSEILYPPPKEWVRRTEGGGGFKMVPVVPFSRAFWVYAAPGEVKGGGKCFFRLDNTPGKNILYFLAHSEKIEDIHDICQRLGQARNDEHRLDILRQAQIDYVKTFEFSQENPAPRGKP